ncbi:MAG: hypothetical protein QM648_08755 [Solirubrobacterales bacterium]
MLYAFSLALVPSLGSAPAVEVAQISAMVLVLACLFENLVLDRGFKSIAVEYFFVLAGLAVTAFVAGAASVQGNPSNVQGRTAYVVVGLAIAPTIVLLLCLSWNAWRRADHFIVTKKLRAAKLGPAGMALAIPLVAIEYFHTTGNSIAVPQDLFDGTGQAGVAAAIVGLWGTQATVVSVRALKSRKRLARDLRATFGGASIVAVTGLFFSLRPSEPAFADVAAFSALLSSMATLAVVATASRITTKRGNVGIRF